MKIVFAQGLYKYRFSQLQESPASCHTARTAASESYQSLCGPSSRKGQTSPASQSSRGLTG